MFSMDISFFYSKNFLMLNNFLVFLHTKRTFLVWGRYLDKLMNIYVCVCVCVCVFLYVCVCDQNV